MRWTSFFSIYWGFFSTENGLPTCFSLAMPISWISWIWFRLTNNIQRFLIFPLYRWYPIHIFTNNLTKITVNFNKIQPNCHFTYERKKTNILPIIEAQSVVTAEYDEYISAEGEASLKTSFLGVTQNHQMVRLWNLEKREVLLHGHYSQINSAPAWWYQLGTHLCVKYNCFIIYLSG